MTQKGAGERSPFCVVGVVGGLFSGDAAAQGGEFDRRWRGLLQMGKRKGTAKPRCGWQGRLATDDWLLFTDHCSATATLTNAGSITNIGWALMPRAQEVMSHVLDGNLTQDGLWTYTWDAENRLARMQSSQMSSNCGAPVMALDFAYDAGGRRMSKTVSWWTHGGWTVLSKLRFVYDGWNLIAELNATNNGVIRTYAWGTDASGSMQGAGGVGGLLWVTRLSDTSTHFTCYDGNHNVMALVNAATGETSAQYEYGPFHELLRATGPMARENVFLAATKYQDWETGFYYYGYRYYAPGTGRWLSRDPIEERGGRNLYGCVVNRPIDRTDRLGLFSLVCDKCTRGNVRKIRPVDTGLVPVINQGRPNSVESAYAALADVEWLDNLTDIGGVAQGVASERVLAEVLLALADAGIENGMRWEWTPAMVSAIETIQGMYGRQQGVYIDVKVSWEKCEYVDWRGLPFTRHLDWVSHSEWYVYEGGDSGPSGDGFAYGDAIGILQALPSAISQALRSINY